MRQIITYRAFDLLPYGHINLIRRVKELRDYLVVGLAKDKFDWEKHKREIVPMSIEKASGGNLVCRSCDSRRKAGTEDHGCPEILCGYLCN